ncbi:MAG: tripartite tricarboxylate transporter substrate binding protein [Alphaproteobacteria bacterium]|nr:MAG: tripartite tricarboxylate transporter substrate binding protein [Alphaproteobacteria bacterium]
MSGAGPAGMLQSFRTRRELATCGPALLVLFATSIPTRAQEPEHYPTRPIRVIVPFAAAGVQDLVSRIIFEKVSGALGQSVVIDNRAGAGGTLGLTALAQSAPDGYTLGVGDPRGSLAAAPSLYPRLPYDPLTSFVPVALLGTSGAVLSVGTTFPAKTLGGLVVLAKKSPGEITFGSTGNGTPGHLNGEMFKRLVGIDVMHVPYRVVSQAITDLMTGRISFWISPIATVLQQLHEGQLRALAVAGDSRAPELPDLPTVREAGFGEFDVSTAYAFFAPAGTPKPVLTTLYVHIKDALDAPDVQERLRKLGVHPEIGRPERVAEILAAKVAQWRSLVREAGIQIEGR